MARNAELALFARNRNVTVQDLQNALYSRHALVDGWDKMMCIYKATDYPYFARLREQAARNYCGTMSWRGQDECHEHMDAIYGYIERNGKTLVTDIPSSKINRGGWGSSRVAGVCCEYLWNSGRIAVADKKGAVKYFDITERVLGEGVDVDPFGSFDEFIKWYVKRRVASMGAVKNSKGSGWLGVFLEDGDLREKTVDDLAACGELTVVEVEGVKGEFYINAGDEKYFKKSDNARAVMLAPLDNMILDRKMINSVFGFDYSWEVYTPAAKRKYGYYVLPIIIGNRFAGRIEPIADKNDGLTVKNMWFETAEPSDEDVEKIICELHRLAHFCGTELDHSAVDVIHTAAARRA